MTALQDTEDQRSAESGSFNQAPALPWTFVKSEGAPAEDSSRILRELKIFEPDPTGQLVVSIRDSLYWGGWAASKEIEKLAFQHDDRELEVAVKSLRAGEMVTILCECPDSLAAAYLSEEQFALAFDFIGAKWRRPDPADFSAEQEDLSSFLVSAINQGSNPDRFQAMLLAFAKKDLAAGALVFLAIDSQNEFEVFLRGPYFSFERDSFEQIAVGCREYSPEVFHEARGIVQSLLEDEEDSTFAQRKADFAVDFINDARRNANKAQGGFKKSGRVYFNI
jgi:hypothetical protein